MTEQEKAFLVWLAAIERASALKSAPWPTTPAGRTKHAAALVLARMDATRARSAYYATTGDPEPILASNPYPPSDVR